MSSEIITREDLELFRIKLLSDLRTVVSESDKMIPKPWWKGREVRSFLKIGTTKLQSLRVTGKLPSSKIGGIHYYRYEDIEKLLKNSGL